MPLLNLPAARSVTGAAAATSLVAASLLVAGLPSVGAVGPSLSDSEPYWTAAQSVGGQGGAANATSFSVAVGSDGTVYITGMFDDTIYFPTGPSDSIALQSLGNDDIFVAAVNADDSYFAWAQHAGGTLYDNGRSVAVNGDGTVLITGDFSGTAYFPTGPNDDSVALEAQSGTDLFIAALNADDSYFAWAQHAGGTGNGISRSVAARGDGTVLVTGDFSGTAYFPTGPNDDSVALEAQTGTDLFIAALNADDSYFAWAQRAGGNPGAGSIQANSVAVTEDGTVLLTGFFTSSAVYFPTGPNDDSVALAKIGAEDMFVAAMSHDDSYFTWAQRAGAANSLMNGVAQGQSVAVTSNGAPIVAGNLQADTAYFPTGPNDDSIALQSTSTYDMFVAAMNIDDSYFAWAQSAATPGSGYRTSNANSVAVTEDDTVIVTGYSYGTTYFPTGPGDDSIALVSPLGGSQAFVAALNASNPDFVWAQQAGSDNNASGSAVATAPSGATVIAGNFHPSVSFPSSADDSITLVSAGAFSAAFLAWLALPASPQPTPTPPTPVPSPPSTPRDAAATAGDASATVTWSPPASSGSFPITTYQAASSPGGKTCLVTAPATSCTIDGLTNGVPYTFSVRALNGAGWSPDSASSAPVTPKAPTSPTIVITGSRGPTEDRIGRVLVDGVTTDLAGALVQSRVHLAGEVDYYDGSTRRVSDDETFTWQRRTKKKVYVYFITEDASVRSNRLIINP
jgi:hypothetical protein